jgi:hypothetical protein
MITRGVRNNNPFNIRMSNRNNWLGKVRHSHNTDGTFEQFVSMKYGLRAGIRLLKNYYFKHDIVKLEDYINRFAPSSENVTSNYIDYVLNFIRDRHYLVNNLTEVVPSSNLFWFMLQAILMYESKFVVSVEDLKKADSYA